MWILLVMLVRIVSGFQRKEFNDGSSFLPNWMGHIMTAIENHTILDLSLPGTHDTMTYDLDTVVSDGGIDGADSLSDLLQYITDHYPDAPLDYVLKTTRDLAITQMLNVTTQLNTVRLTFPYFHESHTHTHTHTHYRAFDFWIFGQ